METDVELLQKLPSENKETHNDADVTGTFKQS